MTINPAGPGPQRLLALDGGGIRGIISIEVLGRIESMVREARADDRAVLADYFHYIAGTSTGAIIAACLSVGMPVATIREFYRSSAREMFVKANVLKRWVLYKYNADRLSRRLREVFGEDTTFGDPKLRTLLMLVLRNATTDSPWTVSNNPAAKYNDAAREDTNLRLPLWQLVRASTAAPLFFPAEAVSLGTHEFLFVDGGVTTYNNPAFQLFVMATAEPYRLCWPTGTERLLLVSIGTGTSPNARKGLRPKDLNLLFNARSIPAALMYAALNEQDFLCRVFGDCRAGDPLDREVGTLIGMAGPANPKLFSYLRYNAELTRQGLDDLGLAQIEPRDVQRLDSIEHVTELQQVGQAVAEHKVRPEHFAGFLP